MILVSAARYHVLGIHSLESHISLARIPSEARSAFMKQLIWKRFIIRIKPNMNRNNKSKMPVHHFFILLSHTMIYHLSFVYFFLL